MLATPGGSAAELARPGWVYELKLDGVRIVCEKRGDSVALWYRTARDATATYPEIASAVANLELGSVVLDGEIVAFDDAGKPSFQRLEQRIGLTRPVPGEGLPAVVYVAFDLLELEGRDMTSLPLFERRKALEAIVPKTGIVRCLNWAEDDGRALFDVCRRERLEGIIAKRGDSAYKPGQRTGDWLKIKCFEDDDFVVVGFTRGNGARGHLGALDIASYEGDDLVLRGKVGSGIDDKTMRSLSARLEALATDAPTARGEYVPAPGGRVHVRPEVVVCVRYGGWTDDARLRHPVFRGVRQDVAPESCRAAPPGRDAGEALASYWAAVAHAMLPYLAGRSAIGSVEDLARAGAPLRLRTDGWLVFEADAAAACALRDLSSELGVPAFVKTGDHADYEVIVPIGDAPPEAATALAQILVQLTGQRARIATGPLLAPYSPVSGAGLRASVPLRWDEVTPALDPRRLTTRDAAFRVAELGDPMAPLLGARVDFARAVTELEKRVSKSG